MNSLQLKLIAMIFMIIDHVGLFIFPNIIIFRILGRIAFPIYAFLLVNTFKYTKDIDKKISKLIIYSLITQMVYIITGIANSFNIFYGMSFAMIIMYADKNNTKNKYLIMIFLSMLMILFNKVTTIYEMIFIYLIYLIDKTKRNEFKILLILLIIGTYGNIWTILSTMIGLYICKFYNGKYGNNKYKNLFWYFYPIHLLIIYGISILIK